MDVTVLVIRELVCQMSSDPRSGCTQGVPDRNCRTMSVRFVHVQVKFLSARQELRCECLVDLYPVDIVHCKIGSCQCLLNCRYGTDTHYGRIASDDTITDEPAKGCQVVFLHGLFGRNNHTSCTVVDTTGVGGSHDSCFPVEDSWQLRQIFNGNIRTWMFVRIHDLCSLPRFDFDGCNFSIEQTLFLCSCPSLLTTKCVFVTFLTCDTVLLGKVLGRHTHRSFRI
mmetsp:Transcript_34144/g.82165  ORF Transcript_34144/g.82165 Transcript_34144/m.82165 type:complete len:225 (+) Transcript_34144:1355-2029(+)